MYLCKKILILILISSFTFASADNKINWKLVESISNLILQDTVLTAGQFNKQNLNQTQKNDAKLTKEFNTLSLTEKYEVLNIVRKVNLNRNSYRHTKEELFIQHAVEKVISALELENIFVDDLSENEFKTLISEEIDNLTTSDMNATVRATCPFSDFPLSIDYVAKPSNTSYNLAHDYSNVVNTLNEFPCDTQLWFYVSKNRVYGLNWATRGLINNSVIGYNGTLSKRTFFGQDRIIVGAKKYLWGLSDSSLSKNLVIW